MKILFKYATRGRPEWFQRTLDGYYVNLSGLHDYEFRVSIDRDDWSMNTPAMIMYLQSKPNLTYHIGDSKTKIEAINADMENAEFDILVVVSDDMTVMVKNFDDIIVRDMMNNFPDIDGALHYNDGLHGKESLITLSIMGKKLYDQLGYIYHPDYESVWCDNEFMDVVKMLNKYWYSPQVIIQHQWMSGGTDETYQKNSQSYHRDKAVYLQRREVSFNLYENSNCKC